MRSRTSTDAALALRYAFVAMIMATAAGCGSPTEPETGAVIEDATPMDAAVGAPATTTGAADEVRYTAALLPINSDLLTTVPSGEVEIVAGPDTMDISVRTNGVPPGIMHMQHFHGFTDGKPARCPGPAMDVNQDGVVDVTETENTAGVTMVPFHDNPASLELASENYPVADERGSYTYRQQVPVAQLQQAFSEKFGGELALDRRVVFVHGVPESLVLADSAQSVLGAPAHVTLPIACGELTRVQ